MPGDMAREALNSEVEQFDGIHAGDATSTQVGYTDGIGANKEGEGNRF